MYCYNCGKSLPDASAFCAYCGEKQSGQQQSWTLPEIKTKASSGSYVKPVKKSKSMLIALMVVGGILFLAIAFVPKKNTTETAPKSTVIDRVLALREKCARLGAEYERITEAAKGDGSIFAMMADGDYVQLLMSINNITTEMAHRFGSLPDNRSALETWTENDLNVVIELMADLASFMEKAIAKH